MNRSEGRILFVEDDQFVGRAAQKRLEADGFMVTLCKDGEEGLHLAQSGKYDIVLLDHMLPGLSGLDILRELQPDDYNPVVMVSATSELHVAVEALRIGAADYVIKETDGSFLDLLAQTVERILSHVHLLRARDEAEKRITEQAETIQGVLDNMNHGVTLFDAHRGLAAFNQQFLSLMEVPQNVTLQRPAPRELHRRMLEVGAFGDQNVNKLADERSKFFLADKPFQIDHQTPTGKTIEIRGAPMPGGGVIATYTDITDRKRMEVELRRLATTDSLTGANNRRRFNEMSERELARCKRYDHAVCVLLLDADNFKMINDNFGHDIGDIVLQELSKTCLHELRDADIFGRFGGEEFAATLPETDLDTGLEVAERLRIALSSIEIPVQDQKTISFTVSIGVTGLMEIDDTLDAMIARADRALYDAKENGRNQVRTV